MAVMRRGTATAFCLMVAVGVLAQSVRADATLGVNLETFIEHVVPILQTRGLFRREYESSTLRGHYGLDRPWTRNFGAAIR
jgi:hypothetical protein